MAWLEKLQSPRAYLKTFLKWTLLGVLLGAVGGIIGAGFHHALHVVTHLRNTHGWLLLLLPVAGIATVAIYRLLGQRNNRGTNEIIDAALEGKPVSPLVAPAIFLASALTHLCGGSAGREGAALQLGGSTASLLARTLRLSENDTTVAIMAGMSAVFAGLFGTPLTACLFTMEFESVGTIFSPALLPCFLAAYVASRVSGILGVHGEVFPLDAAQAITLGNCWKFALLAVLISLLGIGMCWVFHKAEHLAKHKIPNAWVRIALGGGVILLLTMAVGDQRYNGAGMNMALGAVAGNAKWQDFALKLLFTAVTLAAGFKGGEIVPTFCIGATFGCVAGALLGLEPGMAAALGLIGLFCCATNSPLASIVLSIEMFGGANVYLFSLVCVICFVLSGNSGLYASQIIEFSKDGVPSRKLK